MPGTLSNVALEIRFAIADRIHEFFNLVDHGQASKTADIFTTTAKLTFGPGSPKPGTIEGEAIRGAMVAREQQTTAFTRHVISNIIYAGIDAETVAVTYIMVLFRSDDETRNSLPAFVADVAERWVHEADEWRLAERTISPTFSPA